MSRCARAAATTRAVADRSLYGELRKPGADRDQVLREIDGETQRSTEYAVPNELDQLYARLGITGLNAFTTNDATVYIARVPKNRIAQWARVEPIATPTRCSNSEAHATDEVWASMLWEAFNVLIDAYDVPTARRRMSDYVVAGLMLTPPEATFTEARDAILAAASALDSDDMLLMAAAFAGRGAGSCAVSPSPDSLDNSGVVESGTLAARIEVGGLRVSDDAASCDHDGYLDPGETGTLRLTVLNAGPVAAEEVAVTATASIPGIQLRDPYPG